MHVVVGNFKFQVSAIVKMYYDLGTINCTAIGMTYMMFYTNCSQVT